MEDNIILDKIANIEKDVKRMIENQGKLVAAFKDLKILIEENKKIQQDNYNRVLSITESYNSEIVHCNLAVSKLMTNVELFVRSVKPEIEDQISTKTKSAVDSIELQTKRSTRKQTMPSWVSSNYDIVVEHFKDDCEKAFEGLDKNADYLKKKKEDEKQKFKSNVLHKYLSLNKKVELENFRTNIENSSKTQLDEE